jgi:hypothetical protein
VAVEDENLSAIYFQPMADYSEYSSMAQAEK